jgi:hypothetical protein
MVNFEEISITCRQATLFFDPDPQHLLSRHLRGQPLAD